MRPTRPDRLLASPASRQPRRGSSLFDPLFVLFVGLPLLGLGVTVGCGGDPPEPDPVWVDIGTSTDTLEFIPLEPGGPLPLHTFGQGGTHALLAVRCGGLGSSAFISVNITNVETGREVSVAPTASPQLLLCRGEGICDRLPILVMTGGLVPPGTERDGVAVRVRAEAYNADGVGATVERDAVLSAASL